jgi:hypothetical protein
MQSEAKFLKIEEIKCSAERAKMCTDFITLTGSNLWNWEIGNFEIASNLDLDLIIKYTRVSWFGSSVRRFVNKPSIIMGINPQSALRPP